MYAVVGSWRMDAERAVEQTRVLVEQIVPKVKQSPGFVTAYWCRTLDDSEAVSFVAFDDRAQAEAFAAVVQSDPGNRSQHGVEQGDSGLRVVEVTTTA
jgi:quinol monooxygenase YgiN